MKEAALAMGSELSHHVGAGFCTLAVHCSLPPIENDVFARFGETAPDKIAGLTLRERSHKGFRDGGDDARGFRVGRTDQSRFM